MTITAKSCAEFLRKYNDWRRGGEGPQLEPKEIGLNLDFAVEVLEFQHNFLAQITDAAAAADIATLEQESRQMRARMERLEKELEEAEKLVVFVSRKRDELMTFVEEVRRSGDTRLASMAIAVLASAKGGSVEDKGIGGFKPWVATHLKTGNEYRVIGEAIDATNAAESRTVVIYRGNGQTFVRCADEFIDKFSAKGGAV